MKKILLGVIFLCSLLFYGCSMDNRDYYVALSINCDDYTQLKNSGSANAYIETSVNTNFTGRYFLTPNSNDTIEVESLTSSDNSIIEITNINTNNNTFQALAKQVGEANIRIVTKNYHSCTSLVIKVR